jgi:chromosome segregation ATPase
VANLEANFVSFKQDILKSYEEIKKDKKRKDDEIEILKKKITSLETLNELLQKENADLTNISHKQKQLEKKVSNAITLCKNLKQKP